MSKKEGKSGVQLPEPDAFMDVEDQHLMGTSGEWCVSGRRYDYEDLALFSQKTIEDLLQKQRQDIAIALAEYEELRDAMRAQSGCRDGGCLVKRPQGMHTNGGCKCHRDQIVSQRMMYAGQRLADVVRAFVQEAA
ncbi:hypothetical protein [Delftia sp. PE138]|uniref:hypothetical protein n=1 Tax=Delftia sp. PE138 TaxID=1812483 RepID=UPI001DDBBDBF|nr:hypothetical protein [Delftia sp. PE138]MBS3723414.1 hypothetical protein [Delftia sp. PE138]